MSNSRYTVLVSPLICCESMQQIDFNKCPCFEGVPLKFYESYHKEGIYMLNHIWVIHINPKNEVVLYIRSPDGPMIATSSLGLKYAEIPFNTFFVLVPKTAADL